MSNKQTFFWIFTGIILLTGLYFWGGDDYNKQSAENILPPDQYMLILDYGDGKVRKFAGTMTGSVVRAWDLLQQVSAGMNINVEIESGYIPRSIDGIKNEEEKSWNFYINGFKQNGSPFEAVVEEGDTVTFRYE